MQTSSFRKSPAAILVVAALLAPALWACDGSYYIEGDVDGDSAADAPFEILDTIDGGDVQPGEDLPGDLDGEEADPPPPDSDAMDVTADPDIPDIEYDNDLCGGTTLEGRLRVTAVDVSPGTVSGGYYQQAVAISPLPDGGSKVAWNDEAGNARVTPLSPGDTRLGPDHVLAGSEISGFVAHADGSALLVVRDDVMLLMRLDAAGAVAWEVPFVGNNSHTSSGDKWIDSWSDSGRLSWSGTQYAVYFGHTQNWGADGNHQGDYYVFVNPSGAVDSVGWSWGCSHSLEVRLTYNGSIFGPVCLSDCYPGTGIYINGYYGTEISSEPTGDCRGGSAAALGGLVSAADGFFLTFTSPEGRASADVALVRIAASGTPGPKMYLTDTAGVGEMGAKLASYGDNLLAAWIAGGSTTFAVVGADGSILEGPAVLDVQFDPGDDFINFADGSVGWAYGAGNQLRIARLGLCP